MIWALTWKEIRDRKVSLISYTLAAAGLVLLYVALYPSLQGQAQNYTKLMESLPKGFANAFGIDTNFLSSIQGYISSEMFSFMWPLLVIFFMVSRAGSAIAGEIEKGTIGTLLSQPISRTQLYWTKVYAAVLSLVGFTLITILCTIPFAVLFKLKVAAINYFSLVLIGLAFGLAIYGVSAMVSTASSDRTKVYAVTGGILFMMYAANIVAGLKQSLNWLKYVSAFHYYDAPAALVHNHINGLGVLLFLLVALVSLVAGQIIFRAKDISI